MKSREKPLAKTTVKELLDEFVLKIAWPQSITMTNHQLLIAHDQLLWVTMNRYA
jgi:hypothetical protein